MQPPSLFCAEMDLFGVVNLEMSRAVAVGVRPLRDGEAPILEVTDGRVVDLVMPEAEGSPPVIEAAPVQSFAPVQQEAVAAQAPPDSAPMTFVLVESDEEMEEGPQLSRKRSSGSHGNEVTKRSRFEAGEPSTSAVQMR